MKREQSGFVLLETVCITALLGIMLTVVVVIGDNRTRLQKQQLRLACQRFIMDARAIQQHNMFGNVDERKQILVHPGEGYYTIRRMEIGAVAEAVRFKDMGCDGVEFGDLPQDPIVFSLLGSVNEAKTILLRHRDNSDLKLTLNLQPVTGRIEIAE